MSDSRRAEDLALSTEGLPAEQRDGFLVRSCGEDGSLLAEARAILAHLEHPAAFLESSAARGIRLRPEELLADDPFLGRRVGNHRLDALIGIGGAGAVYEASRQDGLLEQRVAIKLLHRWDRGAAALECFRREWQALASSDHPHVARLLDAGQTAEGMPYLVMEYVDGVPLLEHCDAERLPVGERLELVAKVAQAVHFAHQNLVLHLDLKSANVLVTREGTPKLLDFGIAAVLDRGAACASSHGTGSLTPDYASPEHLRGEAVSTASDVYSLGVILHELLVGQRPYPNFAERSAALQSDTHREPPLASTVELDARTATARRTTVSGLRRRLRGDLDAIVAKSLRAEPRRRYASAAQLADDLQRALERRPVVARGDKASYRFKRFVGRHRAMVAVAAALLVALAAGVAATLWQARIATRQAGLARIETESAQQMTELLIDSFLVDAPEREPEETAAIIAMLARHADSVRHRYADQLQVRANLLDSLGRVHLAMGVHDEAEELIDEAAAVRASAFGSDSVEYASSLGSRGELLYALARYEEAAALFERALRIQARDPDHVRSDVAMLANNLGVVMRRLGRLEEAEAWHGDALERRRRELGEQHPLVAESLNNLAALCMARGDLGGALELLHRALAIRRATLGEGHPLVAGTLNNLAVVHCRRGEWPAALALLEEAVQLYRALDGTNAEELAQTLATLSRVHLANGALAAARTAAEESLTILRRRHPDAHPHVASSLLALAALEARNGEEAAAARHADEALAIYRATLPHGHRRIGVAANDYGKYLLEAGHPEQALKALTAARTLLTAALGEGHRHVLLATVNLGRCLTELGRFDEAEPLLRRAHEQLAAEDGAEQIAAQVAQLLDALGWQQAAVVR